MRAPRGSQRGGGGQTRNRIAALDAATGVPTSWNPNASSGVRSLVVSGSTVYAGGAFTSIGGQARSRIAALDATTGAATAWNPNVGGGEVLALAMNGSALLTGGAFTSIGGLPRKYLAALDLGTGAPIAWDPAANNAVYSLTPDGSTLCVGGAFSSINGTPHACIAALASATTDVPVPRAAPTLSLRLENGPNPFRDQTTIRYALPSAGWVRLEVFDLAGRQVATPVHDAWSPAGEHAVEFRPVGIASGIYVARLHVGDRIVTRRMLFVR